MPTIGGCVIQNARRVPDRDALVSGPLVWSWSELDRHCGQVAAALAAAGVSRGHRVALLAGNTPGYVVSALATLRLGAIVVPVNTRLAPPEIAYILRDCEPTVLAFGSSSNDVVRAACDEVGDTGPRLFGLDDEGPHPNLLTACCDRKPVTSDHAAEDDDAYIVYTSGTTGQPKGVLLDHHRAVWAAMAQIVSLGLRDGVRYLHLPPLYHSGGVVFLNATTLLGGTNVLIDKFEPGAVLQAIERFRITTLLGVPTMYRFLLRHDDVHRRDLSSWRTGIFGAAPMPANTVESLLETFPDVEFFQQCGQTEAGPTGIYSTMAQVRDEPYSSGHLAQPFVEARVVDGDGNHVAPGAVGELLLSGEPVMKGYWRKPEETAEVLTSGWLHTGDLMEITPGGAMRLVDRAKDVIISGGRNVYSAEVEHALVSHPEVADCAVVGRPNSDWGETVVAVVTPAPGTQPSLEKLRKHCSGLIADYKLPREVVIGDVPRNHAGKLQKHAVRALFAAS
ncbi:class I adenylate-forming enzyme family protein [Rhodococcus koreensis]|uniref:class I adenylate-forming enzyme family protein n=1 Tax=Rhodococcus koreensis TaxID=99653 RepID=UPI00366CF565